MGLGWLLSAFLMLHHLSAGRLTENLCLRCEAALASRTAWQWGIPLAGWGLVYFAVIGLLLAIGSHWAMTLARLGCATASGVGIVLTASILLSGTSVCFICLCIHASNCALLAVLFFAGPRKSSRHQARVGFIPSLRAEVILALVAVVAGGAFQAAVSRPGMDSARVLAAFRSETQHEIPLNQEDAILGPPDAPVRMDVFSSFRCPGCQVFARTVRRLSERFGGKLGIVFRHFPLGKSCNPRLAADFQPRSCEAAWAAESARRQGLFWSYHDGLFASSLLASEELLQRFARESGIDLRKWESDRHSPEVRRKVESDVELGWQVGVKGTPGVFLNGRSVPDLSLFTLEVLIAREIDAQRRPK